MSEIVSSYVRRHVLRYVNPSKKALMLAIASVADDQGLTRAYRQCDAAADMNSALPTVKRAFQGLLKPSDGAPGPFLKKMGKGRYQVEGFSKHDKWTCDNDECRAEAEASRNAGGRLSEKKRRQAADRARRF